MNSNINILMLEDNPNDAELIRREVKKGELEYTLKHVETGESYINGLNEFKPDLILSDYTLPKFDGMRAIKKAKEITPSTPVIIVTGSINEDTAVECLKAGAVDYVIKENLTRLGSAMKSALERKRDIEEKEEAEEALKRNEKKYRNLFEDSMDMIFLTSYDGKFIDINQAGLDLLGYSREEISEIRVDSVYSIRSKRDKFRKMIDKTGSVRDFEIKLKRKDGSEIDGILSGTVRKSNEGEIIGYQGIVHDITNRKQMEELLSKSESKYRSLVDNALVGVYQTSVEGEVLYVNDALLEMLEFDSLQEFIADGALARYRNPKDRDVFINKLKESGIVSNHEIELLTKSKKIKTIIINSVLKGNYLSGTLIDITERKQAEELIINKHELLLQANEELTKAHEQETELRSQLIKAARLASIGEMAAKIAHEINNPLTVIMGHSQIQMEKVNDSELKESLQKIYSQAEEASHLTRRYMDLGKPVDTKMENINLGEALKKSIATLSGVGHLKLMKISEDYSDMGYDIFGNSSMLEQVFRNLIMNAIHASSESLNKEISVGTRNIEHGNKIEAFIEDKGIGIPSEDLDKIFEDYFTTKVEDAGTGLGLVICKEIVELVHGGKIQVESKQGEGTRFNIIIPKLEFSLQKKKILIVDDDAYIGDLFSEYLSTKGFLVQTCLNGRDALRLFSNFEPDLVLSDYEMPEMNGLELYEAIKEINPRQSFVMITGAFLLPEKLNFLREKQIPQIIKPAELENELLKIVNEQLEKKFD